MQINGIVELGTSVSNGIYSTWMKDYIMSRMEEMHVYEWRMRYLNEENIHEASSLMNHNISFKIQR